MAGSHDDRITYVLHPGDYDFFILGSKVKGESVVYRSPEMPAADVVAALRRIANFYEPRG